jgi:hypothetical protein
MTSLSLSNIGLIGEGRFMPKKKRSLVVMSAKNISAVEGVKIIVLLLHA